MTRIPHTFSQIQHDLIVELLERERNELPSEIRRTQTTDVRERLRQRLEVVDELLDSFRRHDAAA